MVKLPTFCSVLVDGGNLPSTYSKHGRRFSRCPVTMMLLAAAAAAVAWLLNPHISKLIIMRSGNHPWHVAETSCQSSSPSLVPLIPESQGTRIFSRQWVPNVFVTTFRSAVKSQWSVSSVRLWSWIVSCGLRKLWHWYLTVFRSVVLWLDASHITRGTVFIHGYSKLIAYDGLSSNSYKLIKCRLSVCVCLSGWMLTRTVQNVTDAHRDL